MARPIATGYGDGIFTDSQTWSATVASTGETTLGNITVPANEQWNIYSIWSQGTGGEYRLDCTGAAATAEMFEFSGIATVGSTITLVSTDGTKERYLCVAESGSALDGVLSGSDVQFEAGASTGAHAAIHFKAAVEHANGHENKITATLSTAEVTLSQDVVGESGNTTIPQSGTFNDSTTEAFVPNQFTGGTDGLSALVGKFIQNSDGDTIKDTGPHMTDIWIDGPCTLTMYVTNNDATSTVCKGNIQYIRHTGVTSYPIYDENGEMNKNE